jgi:hypothetical protein
MHWRVMLEAWNPNKYTVLRELSLPRLCALIAIAAAAAVAAFLILLIPALLQSGASFTELSTKADLALDASFSQTEAVYLTTNPDILVTAGPESGFITVRPSGFSVKYFLFFGERTYPWLLFSSLDTIPFERIILSFALFSLPSALVWGTFILLLNLAIFSLLYTFIAYFVLHARQYSVEYTDLWKVTLFAGVPSMTVFAAIPILRLGLPLAVIVGFMFVIWLVFSMLGSVLFAHQHPGKFSAKK